VNPWARPWTGPTKEDARRIFTAEATRGLRRIEERRTALSEAAAGRDYPYSYPGAPFSCASFGGGMVAA
jgi:hypothetical protein